ncbi:DUF4091 domain-containing protein [Pseudoroseicyclus aestuarii]|uniref:Uncharacterized protein DUF4091 n=1 Tax=Pseudoroseicyclus aestuarii TaxID=1795041 RepID=A0A318SW57_9RHOB|nr:DUF4091 domain-containing protein [Pseudoroseicyclus aestuarii]PYE85732.1 uncharacterized protein DUF4091 [Pseudoroseicyclus aestuarii]
MSERAWTVVLCDSLEKVFPDSAPRALDPGLPLRGTRGGAVRVQLAVRPPETRHNASLPHPPEGLLPSVGVTADTPDGLEARLHAVDLVPARFLAFEGHDDFYLRDTPGLWPDPLRPLAPGERVASHVGQWQAFWIDIEIAPEAKAGPRDIELTVTTSTDVCIARLTLRVEVADIALEPLGIVNTHWLHGDCTAQYYGVEPLSEPWWHAIDRTMAAAAEIGVNGLLTPVWMPVLDTAPGAERLNVQLLGIRAEEDGYSVDFSALDRWLDLLRKNGIAYVEVAHLFTQWGAEATPPIRVTHGNETRRDFGWDVAATDPRYRRLMEALLPALKAHLAAEWGLERVIFHISDEPTGAMLESYRAARETVIDLLEGCRVVDAMSAYLLYSEGVVTEPVVASDKAQPFLDAGVKPMWLYYCVGQHREVSNRFFAMPSARTRALGLQLWLTGAAGFLHWGLNFYNGYLSKQVIDPFLSPDAGGAFPAGDPFILYPGPEGEPWHSLRGKVLRDAFDDLALMQMLEARLGREAVQRLVDPEGAITLTAYPRDPAHYLDLRNRLIAALEDAG